MGKKKALKMADTFENAVEIAVQFVVERETLEGNQEREQRAMLLEAEQQKKAFFEEVSQQYEFVYPKTVEKFFNQTNKDKEETRKLAYKHHLKKQEEHLKRQEQNSKREAYRAAQVAKERLSKYDGWDVEYLLNELIAWLNDPLDLSDKGGLGQGWALFTFFDGPVPKEVGPIVQELHKPGNLAQLRFIQADLVDIGPDSESVFRNLMLFWHDKPIGSLELKEHLHYRHSGICNGLGELLEIIVGLDMDPNER
jgi:hypothetical protein